MRRIIYTGFIILTLCLAATAQEQPFKFRVSFEHFSNLTYQLDCLSDLGYCNKEDFQALWSKEFLKTDEDKKVFAGWKAIRNRYQHSFEIESDLKFPLERQGSITDLGDKVRIAGLQSKDLNDYLSRLDLLAVPREREDFAKVIRHFEPRFLEWWQREAAPKGTEFTKKTAELLESESVKKNIDSFYNFYGPSLPRGYEVTFDMIFRPQLVKAGTSGQALENRLLVEFFAAESVKQRASVVLHEFCHFMLNSLSPDNHIALQNKFLKLGRQSVVPAFGLMNEALASAFGNGVLIRSFAKPEIWQKYLTDEGSFYNNTNIDRAAKAILPLIDEWLAKGGTLNDDAFVSRYVETLEKTFGESLTAPSMMLAQAYLFLDDKFESGLRRNFRQAVRVGSLYSETGSLSKNELKGYSDNPNMNAVFIIQPGSMNQLLAKKIISGKDLKEIQKAYKAEKKVLYSVKRNENAFTFIIIAENDTVAKLLIENLANADKGFIGKYIAPIPMDEK